MSSHLVTGACAIIDKLSSSLGELEVYASSIPGDATALIQVNGTWSLVSIERATELPVEEIMALFREVTLRMAAEGNKVILAGVDILNGRTDDEGCWTFYLGEVLLGVVTTYPMPGEEPFKFTGAAEYMRWVSLFYHPTLVAAGEAGHALMSQLGELTCEPKHAANAVLGGDSIVEPSRT